MSRNLRMTLLAIFVLMLILLAAQCAYDAGEWVGRS